MFGGNGRKGGARTGMGVGGEGMGWGECAGGGLYGDGKERGGFSLVQFGLL